MTTISDEPSGKVSLWYDPKFRSIVSQAILIGLIIWGFYALVTNTIHNLERLKIASGFEFLNTNAGFTLIQSWIQYDETATYGRAFVAGLINTFYVAIIGIVLATVLGFAIGVARLSKSWVVSKVATVYVEVLRNIPLLLQIIIWYKILLLLSPDKFNSASVLGIGQFNIKGLWTSKFIAQDGFWITGVAIVLAIIAAWMMSRWANKRQMTTGEQFPSFWASLGIVILFPLVVFFATGSPGVIESPEFVTEGPRLRQGFKTGVGFVFIPEFLALLFALVLYTASFIAEIVRAGILAVDHGQTEAAGALGLRRGKILKLVVIPQAMRVIIPPLTSQYLNLTKNSSLAMAIGYPDVMGAGGIVLNQSGQAVEMIIMIMIVYLTFSLVTSVFMNWYNAKMSMVER
jgi:general L-amino acid transport system permease protein